MRAIVLAGGLGTRLRSEVPDLPKPLAPVAGRPFLAWKLEHLGKAGVSEVILSVGYRREAIMDAFGEHYRGMKILYAVEEIPLGTGGALREALKLCQTRGEPVWVMNGDTFVDVPYGAMWAAHLGSKPDSRTLTLALLEVEDGTRYGSVTVENGRVRAFAAGGKAGRALINGGVYLVQPDLFAPWQMPDVFSFEKDFLGPKVGVLDLRAFPARCYFIDIGTPSDYIRAQTELPSFGEPA
jgi:D-glycero-alpha-D-manno-heptose 1-phosphate guanylyltransferase